LEIDADDRRAAAFFKSKMASLRAELEELEEKQP
jgi:hypothetical protein